MVPEGWPLTLGGSGLVLQLGELEASALRLGECYLCVRSAAATATATTTSSVSSGVTAAGEAAEQNTVEVSHVPLFPFFFCSCSRPSLSLSLFSLLSFYLLAYRRERMTPPFLTSTAETRPEFPAFLPE